ncbi:MAG: arginase family protein [Deltaproteobacteria bacterium]|nr:arginase family protein [Deltaproteobacteria bacterium]
MPKISKGRLAKYHSLSTEDVLAVKDRTIREFLMRASEEGYSLAAENFLKHQGFFQAPHTKNLDGVDIAFIGVPMDQGAPHRAGTRHGPQAARKWSHIHGPVHQATNCIPFESCRIIDYGDVEFSSYSARERVEDIHAAYSRLKDADVVPLSIGGEHTITHPILKALGRDEPIGLIHLDAHADTGGTPPGGDDNNDNSVFRKAVLDGAVDPERTIQIGIRGRASILWDFSYDSGMRVVPADEVHEGGAEAIIEEARSILGDGPVYISLDTDVFDPAYFPGTTLPEPFGLTGIQVRDIVRGLRGLDIVGADITELCPPHDPTGISANLTAGMLFEMLCLLTEACVTRTGRSRKTHWA